jgi:hypothetical protein
MAISIDFLTKVISVPQADCTFVTGTFYRLPTKSTFKAQVDAIMAGEHGMPFDHPIDHNKDYTVAGVTYAPKVEIINGYSVQFTPDSQWSVELTESNNNLWDIENGVLVQNQVQVIPTNSAGLIQVTSGSGLSSAQDTTLSNILRYLKNKLVTDPVAGKMRIYDDSDVLLFEGDLWEDADGTQAYRGQGAERRDRMT